MARDAVEAWREDGYLVVRGALSPAQVARMRAIGEPIIRQWRARDPLSGEAGGADGTTLFHPNHPGYHAGGRDDLRDLLEIAVTPSLMSVPRALLGEEPLLRCLSFWFNPERRTLDGNWHRDTQFLHPDLAEERRVFDRLVATGASHGGQFQIALVANEDLDVVPGSHRRWDTDAEFAIRRGGEAAWRSNAMPGAVRIRLEPGDGVIFDSVALHRGRYHADKPRRTFMLTTSRHGERLDDFFTRQPWFLEPGYLDGLSAGARATYERFIEVFAPCWQAQAAAAR